MIPEDLLSEYGCIRFTVPKGQYIFHEDDEPFHYYQIHKGTVKIVNYGSNGQEFIQGMFKDGQPIAEAVLFGEFNFPASGIAVEDTRICKLPKDRFFELLKKYPEIHLKFSKSLSKKLHFKTIVGRDMAVKDPEQQITSIIEYYRESLDGDNQEDAGLEIPFTRQQIAGMTGLRVETIIRTVKKMEQKGLIKLNDHKIII